jgi:quaternary ammonium compound-resistance protein SugE
MLSPWTCIIIAGVFEIMMASFLKLSDGFKNISASCLMLVSLGLSFYFLSLALKEIPLGSAYAIWTGIGAIGTFLLSILFFGELISLIQAVFLLLIIIGIMGLKWVS